MPFTPKSWQDSPATTTPLSAAALIDMETRLSNYSMSVPAWIVGRWYTVHGSTLGQATQAEAIVVAHPIFVPTGAACDQVAVEVATAGTAGAVIRIGIASDSGGYPFTVLTDAGTIDGTTTGTKVAVLGSTLTFSGPGVYWAITASQGVPTTRATMRMTTGNTLGVHSQQQAGNTTYAALQTTTSTFTGAFPSDFTGVSWNVLTQAIRVQARAA